MDWKSAKVYGYMIEPDIQVNINQSRIINIKLLTNEKSTSAIKLRKTMMRLFIYLLENADNKVIGNEEILTNVWDKYGLSSSSQRLWQVMHCLRRKLSMLGIAEDFITRTEEDHVRGFCINKDRVTPIYYFDAKNL
ncbi:helix-turn-helix domain-containing protein [Erwinia sp. 198]|uniref:winged helix-turn-helix domain-containing protein n=1 Tax=Erwinia sp. 198 TaxID=2022746 RepID=UPI000F66F7AA|nr:helix-turn-helix domain-containing protein [Erwinia sp. 198]RRZ96986.1 helix-turn-helix domain-containing protein [Erwinia sp. 198]